MGFRTTTDRLLAAIKDNTANINVNVDTLEVNTDNIETNQTNTILALAAMTQQMQSAHVANDLGTPTIAVRNDTLADLAGADHDYAPLQVDNEGALYTADKNLSLLAKREDDTHTSTDRGIQMLAVRKDTGSAFGADGDYTPLQTNDAGELRVTQRQAQAQTTSDNRSSLSDGDTTDQIAVDEKARTVVVGAAIEDAAVKGAPMLAGGRYDTSDRDLDNGDAGAIALTAKGHVFVHNRDATAPGGTILINGTKAFTGPFYALTALEDAVIDASEGTTNIKESDDSGSMQNLTGTLTIPKGVTIYGSFASIELDSGSMIGYTTKGVTATVAGS